MAQRFLTLAVDHRAVSWQVMLPTALVFGVFGGATGLVAALILWALLALAHRSILRPPFVVSHPTLGVLVTFAGAAAASVLASLATGSGQSVGSWLSRTTVILVLTAAWASLDDYRLSLAAERALHDALANTRADGARRVQQQRDGVIGQVTEMLETTLNDMDDTMAATGRLRELARDRIRPLSHELAEALPTYEPLRPVAEPVASWRTVAMNVLGAPVIRPLSMATLVTMLFAWSTATTVSTSPEGVTTGIDRPIDPHGLAITVDGTDTLSTLFLLALIFVTTWLAGIAALRWTRRMLPTLSLAGRMATVAITLLLMTVAVEVIVEVAYVAPGAATDPSHLVPRLLVGLPIFIVAFFMLLVRTVAELFTSVQRRAQDLSAELAWESARAHETLVQERRFLATAIHGPLQSTVAAAAMGLEEARHRDEDPVQAWELAKAQLGDAVRALADGPPTRRDLGAEIEAMRSTWAGLCDVEVDIDPGLQAALAADWVGAGTVSDLLSEAIANAVMHGQATRVRIAIAEGDGSTMHLVVQNDGHAPEHGSEQGLGSRQLDEVSINWRRDSGADGTTLEIVLPAPR